MVAASGMKTRKEEAGDYFNADIGAWDIQGLQDEDVRCATDFNADIGAWKYIKRYLCIYFVLTSASGTR